jgi:5'-nucleotidase
MRVPKLELGNQRVGGGRGKSFRVHILLTNDDGIYAPGLAAAERELSRLGDVTVVAPATEQSGVGHSITYLTPLIVKEVFDGDRQWGWMVEGSPADCVRIAIAQLCPVRPDLVVSGINGGLNAGINVLYSGTVAAAVEGAFFGITSIALSLEFDQHPRFDKAAQAAGEVIEQILAQKPPGPQLYNVNIPTAALSGTPRVKTVPMDVVHYGERFERRTDPWGRPYYWATGEPPPPPSLRETDLSVMAEGCISVTPLDYDLTKRSTLAEMAQWRFHLDGLDHAADEAAGHGAPRRTLRAITKKVKTAEE